MYVVPVMRIRNKSFGSGFGSGPKLVSDLNPDPNPAQNVYFGSKLDPDLAKSFGSFRI
jgi:hypothetical protein